MGRESDEMGAHKFRMGSGRNQTKENEAQGDATRGKCVIKVSYTCTSHLSGHGSASFSGFGWGKVG